MNIFSLVWSILSYLDCNNVNIGDQVPFGPAVLVIAVETETAGVIDRVAEQPCDVEFGSLRAHRHLEVQESIPQGLS